MKESEEGNGLQPPVFVHAKRKMHRAQQAETHLLTQKQDAEASRTDVLFSWSQLSVAHAVVSNTVARCLHVSGDESESAVVSDVSVGICATSHPAE